MKKLSLLLLTSFVFLFAASAGFSQGLNKPVGNSITQITSEPVEDPQIGNAVKNLKTARVNGDKSAKDYWENKLNELTHPQIIGANSNSLTGKKGNSVILDPDKALNVTTLSTGLNSGNSISRERVNGDIYAAIGVFSESTPDTLKLYRSTNNGIAFTLIYAVTGSGFKITNNSIDVEAVSRGDSSYAFIALSYVYATYNWSSVIRVRQDGGMVTQVDISPNAAKKLIGGRITSDNAEYTTNTYLYFSVVMDSVVAGARNLRSKFGTIRNPFAFDMALTMGYQEAAVGYYGYYVAGTAPDTAKFQTDVAFVNTTGGGDQVYTCTIVRGVPGSFNNGTSLHFARSTTYGATAPTLFNTTDAPYLKENPRIASTGYLSNSCVVVTRRLFGGNDWDPYYFSTGDITIAGPVFTNGYVSNSTDTTMGVAVTAKYRSANTYLFAYSDLRTINNGNIYIRPFSGNTLGTVSRANPVLNIATNLYGLPDPGFRNVDNDSCLVIWGGIVGVGAYVTGGCSGTYTSVGDPNIELKDFRLDQNYPNPFNPTTNISYNLPVSGLVKIVVYDVLGSEVATLLNENKTAGYYSSVFDGKNLASGAYYYKITFTSSDNNSFSQTRKMMLIK